MGRRKRGKGRRGGGGGREWDMGVKTVANVYRNLSQSESDWLRLTVNICSSWKIRLCARATVLLTDRPTMLPPC